MKTIHALLALAAALLALGLTACGEDDNEEAGQVTTVAVTEEQPTTADSAGAGSEQVPAELVGTYETELPKGVFPAGTWGMAIGPGGELRIIPPGETGFDAAPVSVSGDTLVLSPEPEVCDLEGRYTYALEGEAPTGRLTLTVVEDCPDRSWVMGQQPWTRTE